MYRTPYAHQIAYRDAMLRAWLRRTGCVSRNGAASWRPEDVPAYIAAPSNDQRSCAEVELFMHGAAQDGRSYAAYLECDAPAGNSSYARAYRITTFTGDTLAKCVLLRWDRDRRGARTGRGSFWAVGIDGTIYHGRHNGPGMWCRMRRAKGKVPHTW